MGFLKSCSTFSDWMLMFWEEDAEAFFERYRGVGEIAIGVSQSPNPLTNADCVFSGLDAEVLGLVPVLYSGGGWGFLAGVGRG